MGRSRIKDYIDIPLNERDLVRVKNGYRICKKARGQRYSIYLMGKNSRIDKTIAKLQEKINVLKRNAFLTKGSK